METELPPRNLGTHLAVIGAAAFGGACLGTVLNTIDMTICRAFYGGDDLGAALAAIFAGTMAGGIAGTIGGIGLAVCLAASTRLRTTQEFALIALVTAGIVALACWFAGGILGAGLRLYAPNLSDSIFGITYHPVSDLRLGWVEGSSIGGLAGVLIGVLVAAIKSHFRWRRLHGVVVPGFAVQISAPPRSSQGT
jgi:hypothetical protein